MLDVGCHAEGGIGWDSVFTEGYRGVGIDALEGLGYAVGAAEAYWGIVRYFSGDGDFGLFSCGFYLDDGFLGEMMGRTYTLGRWRSGRGVLPTRGLRVARREGLAWLPPTLP